MEEAITLDDPRGNINLQTKHWFASSYKVLDRHELCDSENGQLCGFWQSSRGCDLGFGQVAEVSYLCE